MTEVLELQAKEVSSLKQIENGLAEFNKRKAEFEQLAESAKGVDVTDFNDKEALKIVTAKRIELKNARTKTANEGKAMRDMITPISKAISAKEKELIAITEPEETRLAGREDWVKSELERVEQERIDAENKRIQDRIDKLNSFGYEIDYAELKSLSDETFESVLSAAKSEFEAEQERKKEEERIAKEAEEQRQREIEAEQKRIADERAELAELRAKQAEIERQQKEAQDKIDAENKRLADEKLALEAAKQKEIDDKKAAEDLRIAQEKAAEAARLKLLEEQKEAENKRLEAEKEAAEKEAKRIARMPDKKKLEAYVESLMSFPQPDIKDADCKFILDNISVLLGKINDFANGKINAL